MQEEICFELEGKKILGILRLPETPTQSVVILVHGFTGSSDGPGGIFTELAEEFASKGFAALRFNFRFTTENWSEFHYMTVSGETKDLKVIINEMAKRFSSIGIVGESMGGTIAILSYDERINCLVLWYPAVFPNESSLKPAASTEEANVELERTGFVTIEKKSTREKIKIGRKLLEEIEQIDLTPLAKRITCPTLIVHGDKDTRVPLDQSERLLQLLKGIKRLDRISGAEHAWHSDQTNFNPKAQRIAIELTVEWLGKWLK